MSRTIKGSKACGHDFGMRYKCDKFWSGGTGKVPKNLAHSEMRNEGKMLSREGSILENALKDNNLCCQGTDGPCYNKATKRRQNTAYVDDKMNWVTMCDECAKDNDDRLDEQWREYYAGCM